MRFRIFNRLLRVYVPVLIAYNVRLRASRQAISRRGRVAGVVGLFSFVFLVRRTTVSFHLLLARAKCVEIYLPLVQRHAICPAL